MASLDVESLTDSEIREKFEEFGAPIGPVTATTRKVYLKKLKALISSGGSLNTTVANQSQDEQDDTPRSRRKTMPPPRSTNKSPSRNKSKSPSRASTTGTPLANSTIVNSGSRNRKPSPPENPIEYETRKSSRRSLVSQTTTTPTSVAPSPRLSSAINDQDGETQLLLDRSPKFTTNHNSSPLQPSKFNSASSNLGYNDTFRSRLSTNSGGSYFPAVSNTSSLTSGLFSSPSSRLADLSPSTTSAPFTSDFVKRLSASRSQPRTDHPQLPSPGLASKLLDVKESDDEDSGPAPVYAKFSQGPYRGFAITQTKGTRRNLSNEGWLSLDSPISAILLIIFLSFFVLIGITYVNMHFADTSLSVHTELFYPPCLNDDNHIPTVNCITEKDKEMTAYIFDIVYQDINDQMLKAPCNTASPVTFSDKSFIQLVTERDRSLSIYNVELSIKNLKVLFDNNPKLKIQATKEGFLLHQIPVTYYCYFINNLMLALSYILKILIVVSAFWVSYQGIKWWLRREARHKEEVYKLVGNIVELVSAKAQGGDSFVPISHVRDQLIPPQDRARKAKLWKDALELLETDSRLRYEVQEVEGEEFMVWRWLASSLNPSNKRKMWQGQAFDTMEGSVNSLPHSPTPCLKIRHMFDAEQEEGDEWITIVVDAILEKCEPAKILHVVVDRQSREGCVYMKCASTLDAGIAYRSLHGSWFDSNLITVKYIRERRYLERFPDSAKCTQPLHPSNDNKSSLQ